MKKLLALSLLLAALSGCGLMIGKDRDAWVVYCSAFQERSASLHTTSGTDFESIGSSAQGVEALAALTKAVAPIVEQYARSQGTPAVSNVVAKEVGK